MVRARRAVRRPRPRPKTETHDSDDPACFKDEDVPDKNSTKYVEDEIDEFHSKKISALLSHGVNMESEDMDQDSEEEIMPLTLEDSDDEDEEDRHGSDEHEETDMESDLEGKGDDDLPNDMAWGSKKRMFYDSDYTSRKGKSLEYVEAEDEEEEEEAKNIQTRLVGSLSEEDYDLNLLQEFAVETETEKTEGEEQRIVKDLKTMSQKQKLSLLKKESPELLELIKDFKAKLTELRDEIQPLVQMVKDGQIPPGKGANYLAMKQQLYLNYCTNISFYLVLKAKRIPAHNHPVIERLVTFRNLINELGAVDAKLAPQLCQLLSSDQREQAVKRLTSSESLNKSQESETGDAEGSDEDEEAALLLYRGVEEMLRLKRKANDPDRPVMEGEEEEAAEEDGDAKRGITYQMAKNKGLTPKRKKIDRNPRVKHREKYRRAKIRRKGQVLEVRREEARYSGELSGIRAGVKKSIKLK
ncbi:something about silencing protein 10 isoform X2 [Electrophorus electricus]|uniref:something about silencing protein 10 isoform X2 n=1 Tax=Electrophorus electricus TaxID=8005 RepID=UPI0015D03AB2|nr:something about silencing protein 10 isoform X2 [Electrophorus electricus]